MAAKPVGVAGTVQALVMLQHHGGDRPGELYVLEDLVAGFRVGTDDGHLDVGEGARLAEDLGRHLDLAYVVQSRRQEDAANPVVRQPQVDRDGLGQLRHPPLMAGGIRVPALQGGGQRLHRPFQPPLHLLHAHAQVGFRTEPVVLGLLALVLPA